MVEPTKTVEATGPVFANYCDFTVSSDMVLHNPDLYLFTEGERVVFRVIIPLLLVGGITTNAAFLFVMFRVPTMRTVVNKYLTHIAIADLIFLVSVLGKRIILTSSSRLRYDQGIYWGVFFEVLLHILLFTTVFASVLIMTLVGFERFYAVCRPMRMYASTTNQRKVSILLVIVWTICVLLSLTTIPVISNPIVVCIDWPKDYPHLPSHYTVFTATGSVAFVYTSLIQTVPFFIVLVINSVLYVKMVVTMTGRLGTMQSHDLDVQTNIDIRNKVAVMLIINGVTFFVLTFPFQFGAFLSALSLMTGTNILPVIETSHSIQLLFQLMLYTNSVINPIIYNVANSRYRSSFRTAFGIDKQCCEDTCLFNRLPSGMHSLTNGGDHMRRQTITTTYSSSCVVSTNGEILFESDTKC